MSGYTYSHTSQSEGAWTDWSENPVSPSESESQKVEVQTEARERQVVVGKEYNYYHYVYWGPDYDAIDNFIHDRNNYYTWAARGEWEETGWIAAKPYLSTDDGHNAYGTGLSDRWYILGERDVYAPQPYTVYRSRTINYTHHLYQWSGWSTWLDTPVTAWYDREVNTRTLYRYADKIPHYEYTYERWTDWTAWGDDPVAASDTRKVKEQTIYKYRDMTDIITYHFYQWGNWSDYRDEKVDASDMREVQERTLYRYKEKR